MNRHFGRLLKTIVFSLVQMGLMWTTTSAQTIELQNGSLIEKVVCRAKADQSYALYLPTKYTPERKWPILYAFDPAARGQIPVERFKSAAEQYGWIVVGSNNSRNGPNKLAVDAFEAMWQDTHERFAIDDRRVYATGFSGGARAAVGLAVQCNGCLAGIIANGAGFHSEVGASQSLPFVFFATVGTDDFNFPELKELEGKLVKAGATHWLAVFSGDHDWLPAELAVEAVQWMELQAMKAGRRETDSAFIESLWQARLAAARASEEAGQHYDAYRRYLSMSQDFSKLRDVAAVTEKAASLKETRDVRKFLSDEKEEISKQRSTNNRIIGLLSQSRDPDARLTALPELTASLRVLNKQAKETQDTSQRRVARRVMRSLLVGAYERAERSLRAENYSDAISNFEFATEVAPENPRLFFELACAHARSGQKGRALQALKKSIEKGFSDLDAILTNRALDSLRGEAAYLALIKGLKREP